MGNSSMGSSSLRFLKESIKLSLTDIEFFILYIYIDDEDHTIDSDSRL